MDGIETVSCVCEQQVDDHTFFVIADMEDTRSAISYSGADDYLTMSTNSVNPSDLDDSVIVISDDEEEDVRTTTISQNYANITQYTKLEDLRSSNPNIKKSLMLILLMSSVNRWVARTCDLTSTT